MPRFLALLVVLGACGGREDGTDWRNTAHGGTGGAAGFPQGAGGSETQEPEGWLVEDSDDASCPAYAPLEIRPGACASQQKECNTDGLPGCGECALSEECVANLCYSGLGAPFEPIPPLMRGLYGKGEGTRCIVRKSGVLARISAGLWVAGVDSLSMDVYVSCGNFLGKSASITRPAEDFPHYEGVHGIHKETIFELSPPIEVKKGDTVVVIFYPKNDEFPNKTGVSGVYAEDVDPDCVFVSRSGSKLYPLDDWDYMARLFIHPQPINP